MILSVIGQKGGVGKSTTAICLGAELQEQGSKVLLVDCDVDQRTMLTWREVARGKEVKAPTVIAMTGSLDDEDQLPMLAKQFDHVLIDCPGRIDAITKAALLCSHIALLPCGPTPSDAWALNAGVQLVKVAQKFNKALTGAIVITRKQANTKLGSILRESLDTSGMRVLESELGYRVAYQECLMSGYGVTRYAPRDAAALEIKKLVDEVFGREAGEQNGKTTEERATSGQKRVRSAKKEKR